MTALGLAAFLAAFDPLWPGAPWTEHRVEALVALVVAGRPERAARAIERLRTAPPSACAALERVFGRLARQTEILGSVLERVRPGRERRTLWRAILQERLDEATRQYRAGNYDRARALADAIVTFDAPPAIRRRARILRVRALGKRFRNEVLQGDLVPPARAFEGGGETVLELVLRNLSDGALDLALDPARPVLGSVRIESTSVLPGGAFRATVRNTYVEVPRDRIRIEPGGTWHWPVAVRPEEELPGAVQRLRVSAVLRPADCAVGEKRYALPIEVPPVSVYFVPEGCARLAEEPLAELERAIVARDARAIFAAGAVAALEADREDARDRVIAVLMLALAQSDGQGAGEAMGLLALLTGRRYGLDRKAWLLWYLGRERERSGAPAAPALP